MVMGNLEAAFRAISKSIWLEESKDELRDIFRAYHGESKGLKHVDFIDGTSVPQPEPPEFKPRDWVIYNHQEQLGQLKERRESDGWWLLHDLNAVWPEKAIRHATDEEKFRPGAVVRYEDGSFSIQGLISRTQDDCIEFNYDGMMSCWWFIKYCTLITPAPESSDD